MEKVYLRFGKHKIDITKDVTGDEVTFVAKGSDLGEAIDNLFCNNLTKEVTKKTVFSLLSKMSIEYKDKEEDLIGSCPVFRDYTIKEDGENVLYYNYHCDNRGKYRVSK